MKNDICLSKVNVVFFVKYRFSVRLFEVILVGILLCAALVAFAGQVEIDDYRHRQERQQNRLPDVFVAENVDGKQRQQYRHYLFVYAFAENKARVAVHFYDGVKPCDPQLLAQVHRYPDSVVDVYRQIFLVKHVIVVYFQYGNGQ